MRRGIFFGCPLASAGLELDNQGNNNTTIKIAFWKAQDPDPQQFLTFIFLRNLLEQSYLLI